MSEPSSSRNPSPELKVEKKVKKKRKSITEDTVQATVEDVDAVAVSKAEKKLKKKSSKKAIKGAAEDDVMAVDDEPDAVIEVKAEKKSKKGKGPATEENSVSASAEEAMEVDDAQEAVTELAEPKSDKKLKRKRKDIGEEAPKADEADSGDESDAGVEAKDANSDDDAEAPPVDEPVLSHAERRRRKKEAKLAAKLKAAAGEDTDADEDTQDGATATKKRKLKDGSAKALTDASTTVKRKNSVWVGNLSFKTQPDNLKTFFDGVGEITRINMPTKPPAGPGMKPENRGFAYVDFATPEAKVIAIALSENPLLGRKLLIKDGDDFAGRPAAIAAEHAITDPALAHKTHSKTAQKILRAQKQPPAPTLFFGNLPFDTTDDTIRELLEAHRSYATGKKDKDEEEKAKEVWIRKVRMGTFEDTGACKGFAFVDFMTIEHATSALINPRNHHLNGRKLVIEYAGPDAVRRGAPKGKGDGVFKGSRAARPERTWGGDKSQSPRKSGGAQDQDQDHDDAAHGGREDAGTEDAEAGGEEAPSKRSREHKETSQLNKDGRHKGPRSRPKPGAALALAKRESIAIVPSQGQKITF